MVEDDIFSPATMRQDIAFDHPDPWWCLHWIRSIGPIFQGRFDAQFFDIPWRRRLGLLRCLLLSNVRRSLLGYFTLITDEAWAIFLILIFLLFMFPNSLWYQLTAASSCSVVGFVFSSFFIDTSKIRCCHGLPWMGNGLLHHYRKAMCPQKQRLSKNG